MSCSTCARDGVTGRGRGAKIRGKCCETDISGERSRKTRLKCARRGASASGWCSQRRDSPPTKTGALCPSRASNPHAARACCVRKTFFNKRAHSRTRAMKLSSAGNSTRQLAASVRCNLRRATTPPHLPKQRSCRRRRRNRTEAVTGRVGRHVRRYAYAAPRRRRAAARMATNESRKPSAQCCGVIWRCTRCGDRARGCVAGAEHRPTAAIHDMRHRFPAGDTDSLTRPQPARCQLTHLTGD